MEWYKIMDKYAHIKYGLKLRNMVCPGTAMY